MLLKLKISVQGPGLLGLGTAVLDYQLDIQSMVQNFAYSSFDRW